LRFSQSEELVSLIYFPGELDLVDGSFPAITSLHAIAAFITLVYKCCFGILAFYSVGGAVA
jgi:hypothetical protein